MAERNHSSRKDHRAVEDLESLLMKAHQDLTFVRRELDKQFDKSYPNNVNPCKLVSRIRRIQEELPSLKEQCRELLTAKQDLIDNARSILVGNRSLLQRLQASCGLPVIRNSEDAAYMNLVQIMDEWTDQVKLKTENQCEAEDINRLLFSAIVQNN
ncbi:hypothetical protein QJS10_CPB17g00151 [Acorus calamus]|uniref:Protein FAM33A n=1 Tax=Acorus calamus TaxID=4465 RepID=A0AAV9CW03_ACOCL|nr:hypothetical protein QJS10_CPB17g00151 [Acorus calamus]